MQPIFLTSLTTIAGIAPLIYANELWRGLSLTVIFGLIFSTVLILVIIPIYYASICKKEYERRKKKIEIEFLKG
jgi:multidrug efflux pump subunit AcrB